MMKTFFFTLLFINQSFAGLLYPYNRLATKDLDQMNQLIKEKIKESRSSGGNKTIPLKEALQAVFSRPNEDAMIEKILPSLKAELDEHDAWEKTVNALIKEAAGALKNPKAFKAQALVTYTIFLENLISEMRPKANEPFESSVLHQIGDAKIELTKESVKERKLRMMKEMPSPSEIADQVLKAAAEQERLEREKAEKEKKEQVSAEKH